MSCFEKISGVHTCLPPGDSLHLSHIPPDLVPKYCLYGDLHYSTSPLKVQQVVEREKIEFWINCVDDIPPS